MKRQILAGCCLAAALLAGCGGKTENFKKAEQALEAMNYELALEGYEKAIEQDVKTELACRGAGVASMNLGNYEEAVSYFSQAFLAGKLKDTTKRDILQYLATAYYYMEDYPSAMGTCQTLMTYTMNAESYFITAVTALAMNSYDEAERNFRNTYSQDPTYETAFRIYQAYMKKGMQADAAGYLEMALEIPPSTGDDYCNRGTIYFYLDQYEEALAELETAVEKKSAKALLVMGEVYRKQKDYTNAREKYQAYVSGEGPSAKGYNGLALCDIAEGAYENALSNINLGIACVDLDVTQDLMFNQVVVYEKLMDYENALQKLQAYLERYPDDENAKREAVFLDSRIRQAGVAPVEIIRMETIPDTGENASGEEQETAESTDDAFADAAAGTGTGADGYDTTVYDFDQNGFDQNGYDTDTYYYDTNGFDTTYGYDTNTYSYDTGTYDFSTDAGYLYDETAWQ